MIFILILSLILLINLFFVLNAIRRNKIRHEIEERREGGLRENNAYFANATIEGADAGMAGEMASQAIVSLVLHVRYNLEKPYRVKVRWLVDLVYLDTVKPGNEIAVKIDQDDAKIVYPGVPWAKYAG